MVSKFKFLNFYEESEEQICRTQLKLIYSHTTVCRGQVQPHQPGQDEDQVRRVCWLHLQNAGRQTVATHPPAPQSQRSRFHCFSRCLQGPWGSRLEQLYHYNFTKNVSCTSLPYLPAEHCIILPLPPLQPADMTPGSTSSYDLHPSFLNKSEILLHFQPSKTISLLSNQF